MKEQEIQESALNGLLACLHGVPFVEVEPVEREPAPSEAGPDFALRLRLPDAAPVLVVGEVKRSGQPKLAREAANAILRYRQSRPDAYGVFVAPYVSPEAAKVCREAGVGYADLAGNCRLSLRGLYIEREGKPNPFGQKRDLRSLYSPKASRVLRVLLCNPDKNWRLATLAQEAKVSLGEVANVKKLLADREWVRAGQDGLRLSEPELLLTEWAANYDYRRNAVGQFYSLKSVSEMEYDLVAACAAKSIRCALTGFSAAARLAPYVRSQRATLYVDGDAVELANVLGLKRVPTGGNVILLRPYDAGVFYGTIDYEGVPLVSAVQTYLDLRGMPGRGEDGAEFLRQEVISKAWQTHAPTTTPRQ